MTQIGNAPLASVVAEDGSPLYRYPVRGARPADEELPSNVRPLPVKVDADELASLRAKAAERDHLTSERDRLAQELEAAHRRLDVLEASGQAAALLAARKDAEVLRDVRRQILAIVRCRDLRPEDRVIAVLAIEAAGAYRVRLSLGDEMVESEPGRIWIGQLAEESGIPARKWAPALDAAMKLGLLTRTVQRIPPGGDGKPRTEVYVGPHVPGTGTSRHGGNRREQYKRSTRTWKEKADGERTQREQEISERLAALEARGIEVLDGCPGCGGEMAASIFQCPSCGRLHPTAQLAESASWGSTATVDDF